MNADCLKLQILKVGAGLLLLLGLSQISVKYIYKQYFFISLGTCVKIRTDNVRWYIYSSLKTCLITSGSLKEEHLSLT